MSFIGLYLNKIKHKKKHPKRHQKTLPADGTPQRAPRVRQWRRLPTPPWADRRWAVGGCRRPREAVSMQWRNKSLEKRQLPARPASSTMFPVTGEESRSPGSTGQPPQHGPSVLAGCGSQSFFRRLYSSRLLFSPAQVRLLVRNLFKSSLKSSWCMGR